MTVRILLADDHQIVREGLRNLLERQPGFETVGEAADGPSAVQRCRELSAQVVIMDLSMPGLNGIEATRQILAENPAVRVLILSMHSDRRYVLQALKAGASGYLLKDSAFDELVRAIQTVRSGRISLSPALSDQVLQEYVRQLQEADDSVFSRLTSREREVLQLLAEGRSTKEIAGQLHVSVKTVETHRKQIMDRLDLHSVAELTKYAIREGLTQL